MIYVLVSGGMDSLAALHWAVLRFGAEKVHGLYFDIGHRYANKERAAVGVVCRNYGVRYTVVEDLTFLSEHADAHVPFRNLQFILRAAVEPDCNALVFGMFLGETSEDKGRRFCCRVQRLVRSQLVPNVYGPGRRFTLLTPFAYKTKAQMLRWYLATGGSRLVLTRSVSCYSADNIQCGECMACVNRRVACVLNGIHEEFKSDPLAWYAGQCGRWLAGGFWHMIGRRSGLLGFRLSRLPWLFELWRVHWRMH